ncbi:UDP-N-acetylmuramoyl-tripeptide--D-alanyl-D-alanine ligase [Prosthecobacter sp.]|jgi:UDP-N-acetylmuramoyl-tripeptide--D-alanyl-D-alanine ligase|uniref:UDP-N-acetylmuramoyl-tripeptide--D-alanyl-D- alanine ligase n=1 Tax=Prosthecobacter sp. TaxID=1965333 RepID=UPI003784DD52
MTPIPIQTLAQFAAGTLRGDGSRLVTQVNTDSRKITSGDVFVALVGDKFDAHKFIPQVAAAGAAAVVVSKINPAWGALPCAVIEVGDTLVALQQMARGYRLHHSPLIIGLTGSNGKTSTKDLAAIVMSRKFVTRATFGNLNNHIGVPLTLLSLQEGEQCCVTEMGMNHPGEIKVLTDIAAPDAGILTNVGMAHIEHMGTQDAIAWEKATLPAQVKRGGIVVLPANDKYTPVIARHCQAAVSTAGVGCGDVSASNLRADGTGTTFTLDFSGEKVETRLPILGEHMVSNAALAACMGWRQGIAPADIADALNQAKLTGGRVEPKMVRGVQFIDDSYNANPDSMIAGLRTLSTLGDKNSRRVAVLGRMGELGPIAEAEHRRVGEFAGSLKLDAVFSVGGSEAEWITEASKAVPSEHFPDQAACAARLREWLREGDVVLLKGSRSARMEQVLTHFSAS